mgnify:FL=1
MFLPSDVAYPESVPVSDVRNLISMVTRVAAFDVSVAIHAGWAVAGYLANTLVKEGKLDHELAVSGDAGPQSDEQVVAALESLLPVESQEPHVSQGLLPIPNEVLLKLIQGWVMSWLQGQLDNWLK